MSRELRVFAGCNEFFSFVGEALTRVASSSFSPTSFFPNVGHVYKRKSRERESCIFVFVHPLSLSFLSLLLRGKQPGPEIASRGRKNMQRCVRVKTKKRKTNR